MSFRPVRYAGLAVWQSRHPGVCAWVRSMMESAMEVVAKDRVRERYTLALTAFTPADAGTETADIFNKPDQPAVSWGTVNQEYRSLLATAASFLQNHTFSDRRQSAASAAASDGGGNNGGGGGGNEKFDVFRDEDDASNLQGSFTQAEEGGRRDDWSFSVTVEVPPGGVDSDAEMPVSFLSSF